MLDKKVAIQKCINMANEISKRVELSLNVYDAISKTQRELFVPVGFKHFAYKLDALPLSSAQWISSPLTVAKMTQALKIDKKVDSVLEIGCGSGYQAAILSNLVRRVFTIERISSLLDESKSRFKELGINNIHTRCDDGQNGWRSYAPFDRILFSAYTLSVPQKLFDQLCDGGILIAPVLINDKQYIKRYQKDGVQISEETLDECSFVPIENGVIR